MKVSKSHICGRVEKAQRMEVFKNLELTLMGTSNDLVCFNWLCSWFILSCSPHWLWWEFSCDVSLYKVKAALKILTWWLMKMLT